MIRKKWIRPAGMNGFRILWLGQFLSQIASGITAFALTVWMYQKTNSVLLMGIVSSCFFFPRLIAMLLSGILIDKLNRRTTLILSDSIAAVGSVFLFLIVSIGTLQPVHIYVAVIFIGIGEAIQDLAYSTVVPLMLEKDQFDKGNGLLGLLQAGTAFISPLLAGFLFPVLGLVSILLFDFITYVIAISFCLVVDIPGKSGAGDDGNINIKESLKGLDFIKRYKPMLLLLIAYMVINFSSTSINTSLNPLLLSAETGTKWLGIIQASLPVGAIVSGILISTIGGFKVKMKGLIIGFAGFGLFGGVLFSLMPNIYLRAISFVLAGVFIPIGNTASDSLWQMKTPMPIQGRVFSIRGFLGSMLLPIAPIVTGFLVDYVIKPFLINNGISSISASDQIANQVLIFFSGSVIILTSAFSFLMLRNIDSVIPDANNEEA